MWSCKYFFFLYVLAFVLLHGFLPCQASSLRRYRFIVKETRYKRLCESKKILTVNGGFPGPTLHAHKGDTIIVDVHNRGNHNITIHWHGVTQLRNPWSDGPEYITQCPIQPGKKFSQKVIFSSEEGTLWWHAHSDWSRATVHGAIVVYPKHGTEYPFPKPDAEIPIVLGEWWKRDVMEVLEELLETGRDPRASDAFTINGKPGDLYPCSKHETFKLKVEHGKTYLLRFVNAAMNDILFFSVAKHKLKVVGTDGSYTKPLKRKYIVISPGQTLDCLLRANRQPNRRYYMAAKAYSSGHGVNFDNTTTTGLVEYISNGRFYTPSSTRLKLPYLPDYNDTNAAFDFFGHLRSLASKDHSIMLPEKIMTTQLISTVSVNLLPCDRETCEGPNGSRLAASMNNITFVNPSIAILEAYYKHVNGVYGEGFPDYPPFVFNYTADFLPLDLETPERGTEVKVLEFNSTVEFIFQGTNVVAGLDHPMHLHGYSFYIVGWGFGHFDKDKDPIRYNLVDPPLRNTVTVPKNGWAAVRFEAHNPGVWFMHCHLERHLSWGMNTVFIVKDGDSPEARMLPPPPDMPPC